MRLFKLLAIVIIILGAFTLYKHKTAEANATKAPSKAKLFRPAKNAKLDAKAVKKVDGLDLHAIIYTNRGEIHLKLFPEIAPFTVLNFAHLAKKGYYDGLTFHRVIKDFMIQGGDPSGTGAGGPGYKFADEFVTGVTFNTKGKLAMANAGKNTNGSQFFITHVDTPWLNYKHTIFGEVESADDQKVVDAIQQKDVIEKIEITGNYEDFLVEENKALTEQIDKIIGK